MEDVASVMDVVECVETDAIIMEGAVGDGCCGQCWHWSSNCGDGAVDVMDVVVSVETDPIIVEGAMDVVECRNWFYNYGGCSLCDGSGGEWRNWYIII